MASYREHALDGASAVDLVVALYDGIIRFLYAAIAAVERGDADARRAAVKRALDIIIHLQARCAWMWADGRRRRWATFMLPSSPRFCRPRSRPRRPGSSTLSAACAMSVTPGARLPRIPTSFRLRPGCLECPCAELRRAQTRISVSPNLRRMLKPAQAGPHEKQIGEASRQLASPLTRRLPHSTSPANSAAAIPPPSALLLAAASGKGWRSSHRARAVPRGVPPPRFSLCRARRCGRRGAPSTRGERSGW